MTPLATSLAFSDRIPAVNRPDRTIQVLAARTPQPQSRTRGWTRSACGPPAQTVSRRTIRAAVAPRVGCSARSAIDAAHGRAGWRHPHTAPFGDQRRPGARAAGEALLADTDTSTKRAPLDPEPRPPWLADRDGRGSRKIDRKHTSVCRSLGQCGALLARLRLAAGSVAPQRRAAPATSCAALRSKPVKDPAGECGGNEPPPGEAFVDVR